MVSDEAPGPDGPGGPPGAVGQGGSNAAGGSGNGSSAGSSGKGTTSGGSANQSGGSSSAGSAGTQNVPPEPVVCDDGGLHIGSDPLRRLSSTEYVNTLGDLFPG